MASTRTPDIRHTWPLSWPDGRPRSAKRKPALFRDGGLPLTMEAATERLVQQLGSMTKTGQPWRTTDLILSSNIRITRAGTRDRNLSRAEPQDPGVAFYFDLDSRPHVLACDRWDTVADNVAAIAAHIEALRGQERWGVADLRQAFAGHAALPAPVDAHAGAGPASAWWTVLGVSQTASLDVIEAVYRRLARTAHPDAGGTRLEWDILATAYAAARAERGA